MTAPAATKKESSPPRQGGGAIWGSSNLDTEQEEIKSFDRPAAPLKRDNGRRDRSSNRFEPLGEELDKEEGAQLNTSMREEKQEEEKKPAF